MAKVLTSLEIDRLTNLVQGFGWKVVKQELTEDKIKIELEKTVIPSEEVEAAVPA